MSDPRDSAKVYTFHIGEAYDDLTPAFVIDSRDYPDPGEMKSDLDAASRFLREHHVISERETSERWGGDPPRRNVPTWREWRERHVVRGEPLPVRPRPEKLQIPDGWHRMSEWLETEHQWLRTQLFAAARAASPSQEPVIARDMGPVRRSPGSVDLSEERYGLDVMVDVLVPEGDPVEAVRAAGAALAAAGWQVDEATVGDRYVKLTARARGHRVSLLIPRSERLLTLMADSKVVGPGDFAEAE